ncbi:hypothetical protein O1W68_21265 [Rhodococcus sp. H36-A4]|uniref:hypothetical protein n=1 Tax=Rhodococcus sp. H36-A4 TaxID=3004353 RepID=UPI0022AF0825|nr:hypothetical protein [Rhodococcus sp. H36-A4]MCZ4080474.1 hypothetical protein [Rhodococcus sp. H36-A4]
MNHSATVGSVAACAAVAVLVLIGAGPARPQHTVLYSNDGVTWASTLSTPMFDREIRWVPGDARTSQFHIYNDTENDGRVQLMVESDNSSFARSLSVSIDGDETGSACASSKVAAGAQHRIDTQLSMADDTENHTQKSTTGIDLVVRWDNEDDLPCSVSEGRGMGEEQEGAQR